MEQTTLVFVNWQVFAALLVAGLVGVLSVIPLNNSVLNSDPNARNESAKLSNVWLLERAQQLGIYIIVLSAVLLGGFFFIDQLGIEGAPLVEMWVAGHIEKTQFSTLILPALSGFVIGAMLSPMTLYESKDMRIDFYKIALWKRLLAGVFHGGIVEEILFRWCLLSLLAWGITLIVGANDLGAGDSIFWAANIGAALLFGLGHLPGSVAAAPLTAAGALVVVSSNALVGLLCGYFFWTQGIEAAIAAHVFTHFGLQPSNALLRRLFRRTS